MTDFRIYLSIAAGLIVGAVAGCHHEAPPPPAGVDCTAACERGAQLHNPDLGPTPAGIPCSTWLCATPMSSSRATCIAHAADVASQDACR